MHDDSLEKLYYTKWNVTFLEISLIKPVYLLLRVNMAAVKKVFLGAFFTFGQSNARDKERQATRGKESNLNQPLALKQGHRQQYLATIFYLIFWAKSVSTV